MNNVSILGRLVAAAIPYGSGEQVVARFTLAVPRSRKNDNGSREVDYIDCVAFGKLGETVLGYLDKGCRCGVSGRLSVSSYTDKDGVKRRSCSVVCSDVSFCDFKDKKEEKAAEVLPPPPPPPANFEEVYPF